MMSMVHSINKIVQRLLTLPINLMFPLAFIAVFIAWGAICLLSRQPTESTLIHFLLLAAFMALPTLLVLRQCNTTNYRLPLVWVLISAAALRIVSVGGEPLFEDDYYRYLWDGYQTITTNDPYSDAPGLYFDQDVPEVFEPILSLINYPEIATVYGPVSQWFFALGYMIAPGEIWPLQLLSALADLVIMFLLSRLGAGNALLLYAWSPLILKEYSLTAHPDVFSVAFMFVSIWAAYRHRSFLAGAALGLALGAKVFALLIVPFLFTSGWAFRHWLRLGSATAVCLALITISFGTFGIWIPEGLLAMADSWLFNSPLYYLLLPVANFTTIKILLISAFTLYAMVVFCRRLQRDWPTLRPEDAAEKQRAPISRERGSWVTSPSAFRGDWLFALFLLALPVINPWYLPWLLPFAVLFPSWWSWTASFAVLLSYWYGSNVGAIGADSLALPIAVLVAEYLLIVLVSITAWLVSRSRASN